MEASLTHHPTYLFCILCNILYNKSVNIQVSWVLSHLRKLIKPNEGIVGTPIYSWLVRSSGKTTLGLRLVYQEGEELFWDWALNLSDLTGRHWVRGHPADGTEEFIVFLLVGRNPSTLEFTKVINFVRVKMEKLSLCVLFFSYLAVKLSYFLSNSKGTGSLFFVFLIWEFLQLFSF
jgi:hypothetical protein